MKTFFFFLIFIVIQQVKTFIMSIYLFPEHPTWQVYPAQILEFFSLTYLKPLLFEEYILVQELLYKTEIQAVFVFTDMRT